MKKTKFTQEINKEISLKLQNKINFIKKLKTKKKIS